MTAGRSGGIKATGRVPCPARMGWKLDGIEVVGNGNASARAAAVRLGVFVIPFCGRIPGSHGTAGTRILLFRLAGCNSKVGRLRWFHVNVTRLLAGGLAFHPGKASLRAPGSKLLVSLKKCRCRVACCGDGIGMRNRAGALRVVGGFESAGGDVLWWGSWIPRSTVGRMDPIPGPRPSCLVLHGIFAERLGFLGWFRSCWAGRRNPCGISLHRGGTFLNSAHGFEL